MTSAIGGIGAPAQSLAEIVERLAALAECADGDVGIEPDERAFLVVIDGAPQVAVIGARAVEHLRGYGGIFERTPRAAFLFVERGGFRGQRIEEILSVERPLRGVRISPRYSVSPS